MPRIVLFHPAFRLPGGAELLCASQARQLLARGYQVRLVTFAFNAAHWAEEFKGVEVVVVKRHAWNDGLLSWNREGRLRARGRRAGRSFLDADIVLAHNNPCNLLLGTLDLSGRRVWQCNEPPRDLHRRLANPYLSRRVDETPGGTSDFATGYWGALLQEQISPRDLQRRVESAKLDIDSTRRLDSVYAISEFSRGTARAIYGTCDENVVYPFVRFPSGGTRSGPINKEGLQVLVQTRLEMVKNVDSVIRGFASYLQDDPGATLHIVGDGPLRGSLEDLAQSLLPPQACKIHGYLSQEGLRAVYDRCDVFVLLTIDEPFGMVFPEAAARGLLLVGPDHGGPLEILEAGGCGHCIDPFEPEALTQALGELRSLSTEEANRRRRVADRSCRARFGDEAIGASLLRALDPDRVG